MITISPCFLAHHKRPDGTYPAKMRVTFRRRSRWLATTINARSSQLTRSLHPRDPLLIRRLSDLQAQMYDAVADLNTFALEAMDVDAVVSYIRSKLTSETFRLDFFEYGRKYAETMQPGQTRESYVSALLSFSRVTKRDKLDINEITTVMLRDYLEKCPAKKSTGQYLSRLGRIYDEARLMYNDEDTGVIVIPRDPFSRVKAPRVIADGARILDTDLMQRIISAPEDDPDRWALDIFVLSFALMGANMVDLWHAAPPTGDVWTYNRQKTAARRADKSEMRVRIPPEVSGIVGRLRVGAAPGKWLNMGRSNDQRSATIGVNRGLKDWSERNGVDAFTMYSARKTFATEARKAGVEKATIDECLAHVGTFRIADIYIQRQWEVIWAAQRKVLDRFKWR